MLKKIISIALAVVMIMSMAVLVASAADTDNASAGAEVSNSAGADTSNAGTGAGNEIYFDASQWKNYKAVYCHIWERGGDSFFSWQSKKEMCKQVGPNKFSYDLSNLDQSTDVTGGMKSGKDYCVIFSNNLGVQTYDLTMGRECIGDTAKVTGKMIENPVDSDKKAGEAVWSTNTSKYGPHLAISSIGNIIGTKLCPNESGAAVIGDWIYANFKSQYVDPVAALGKAMPKFGVKDIETVYAYVVAEKKTATADELSVIKGMLEDAYKKAYGSAAKIDENKAKEKADSIKRKGGSVSGISTDSGNSGGSTGSTNSSGSGADGQSETIFFILGAVMILAAGAMVATRKRREF